MKIAVADKGYVGLSDAMLLAKNHEVTAVDIVYKPALNVLDFFNSKVIKSLDEFKQSCDVMMSNCMVDEIRDIKEKVYTHDLFGSDLYCLLAS